MLAFGGEAWRGGGKCFVGFAPRVPTPFSNSGTVTDQRPCVAFICALLRGSIHLRGKFLSYYTHSTLRI